MLRGLFLDRFDDLLAAWRNHDRLRVAATASVQELAESRRRLDDLRHEANTIRRAFAPEPKELESVLMTTFCATLDETVFLFQNDAEWSSGPARFRCACGSMIDEVANPARDW
jgi:hypothetical protein